MRRLFKDFEHDGSWEWGIFKKKQRSMGNHGKFLAPSLLKRLQDDIKIERYVYSLNFLSTFLNL